MFFRKTIIAGMNVLALFSHMKRRTAEEHLSYNSPRWKKYYPSTADCDLFPYITDQAALFFLKYGQERRIWRRLIAKGRPITAAFNCCEVIAAMNALIAAGVKKDAKCFPQLLRDFERRGIILSGYFGTAPGAIVRYLKGQGLSVKKLSARAFGGRLVDITPQAYIFITQNGRSLFSEVHTMCIIKSHEGYRILNDFEGNRAYPTLPEAIRGYRDGDNTVLAVYEVHYEI